MTNSTDSPSPAERPFGEGITDAERKKIQDMIVHHLHSGGST